MNKLLPSIGSEIDIPCAGSILNTWRYAPRGTGPWPAVLVLMDAPGIRPALHEIAVRIASAGYLVLMPNLYYRLGRNVQVGPTRGDPEAERNRDLMLGYIKTLSNSDVTRDIGAVLAELENDPSWDRQPVGLTGYCMSGRFAVLAAAAYPERVSCAASFFGTRLVNEEADSPHLAAGRCEAELYFAFAEHDHYAPPPIVATLAQHLASTSVRHRIETYPGTEHGFVFPDRGSYQEEGTRRHWETLFTLFDRHLKPKD